MKYLLMFWNWLLSWFKPTVATRDNLQRSESTLWVDKKPALNPVRWKKMIHKLKSKNGVGMNHFGTFSPCKPFKYTR